MSSPKHDTFYIGVNVFVIREQKLLLGKRKNVFGDGTWCLPGGHMMNGESISGAGARELAEETGLQASDLDFVGLVNTPKGTGHHLQIGFLAKDASGEVELKEPEHCYEWRWFGLDELPENIFPNHDQLIRVFKEKSYFADSGDVSAKP